MCTQPAKEERGSQQEQVSEVEDLLSQMTRELSTLRAECEQLDVSKRRQAESYKRVISELKQELVEVSQIQNHLSATHATSFTSPLVYLLLKVPVDPLLSVSCPY